jgi:hypothetical protein
MKLYTILIVAILLGATKSTIAQESTNSEIFITLKKADSLVFTQGFNKCDFKTLENIMHKDLQFFHDLHGLQNREEFLKGFKESICTNTEEKPIRKLVDSSLVVYPLKKDGKIYGAIQMGVHEFYIAEPHKEDRFTSNGKFIHTWLIENGEWKLYKVMSYDHRTP